MGFEIIVFRSYHGQYQVRRNIFQMNPILGNGWFFPFGNILHNPDQHQWSSWNINESVNQCKNYARAKKENQAKSDNPENDLFNFLIT